MTAPDPAWVEAGVQAVGRFDYPDREVIEVVITAVEPLIRAKVLADLRAKVEGLAEESHMADSPGLIWRSDVLALIDGAQ